MQFCNRFPYKSEEDFGEHMCKLREAESRHRESRRLISSTRFAPHHPNFLGALSYGEPQTRTMFVP